MIAGHCERASDFDFFLFDCQAGYFEEGVSADLMMARHSDYTFFQIERVGFFGIVIESINILDRQFLLDYF